MFYRKMAGFLTFARQRVFPEFVFPVTFYALRKRQLQ
jgi:hypothetical protein